jgi:hypothetical protein
VVGDQPGRLLPGPPRPLRRRGHLRGQRQVRERQLADRAGFPRRVRGGDPVHERGVLGFVVAGGLYYLVTTRRPRDRKIASGATGMAAAE